MEQLIVGQTYKIKLTSGEWTEGRLIQIQHNDAHYSDMMMGHHTGISRLTRRANTRYVFTNLRTGRTIVLKSLAKVRQATERA